MVIRVRKATIPGNPKQDSRRRGNDTSAYGAGSSLFKVSESGGKFSVEQVYANKVMENHDPGVVKVGDYVYGFTDGKQWICQDFKSGNNAIQAAKIVVPTP